MVSNFIKLKSILVEAVKHREATTGKQAEQFRFCPDETRAGNVHINMQPAGKYLVVIVVFAIVLEDVAGINVAEESQMKRAMIAFKDFVVKAMNAMNPLSKVQNREHIPTPPPIPPEI
ncbi:uncharacterized protein ISCGN_029268 [Ixodes scapularis]